MQVAEDRLQPHHAFAIQRHIHAEDAVSRGVVRPHRHFQQFAVAAPAAIDAGRFQPSIFSFLSLRKDSCFTSSPVPCSLIPVPCCSLQHLIVRRRLVLEVIRLNIIAAHGMILEAIPHQQPPQIRVARKDDSVEIEDLALLKLRRAPDRRQRGQIDLIGPVHGCMRITRPVLFLDGIEMIDGLKETGSTACGLFDGSSTAARHHHGLCNGADYFSGFLSGQSTPVTLER